MKHILLAASLLVATFLTACYDDKGNYAYSAINEITIDTIGRQTEFEVFQFDSLRVEPAIRFALEDISDEDMEYRWTIFNNGDNNRVSEVIGTERNLACVVRQASNITPYSLVLDAKNKQSGIATQMIYTVNITSNIVSGLVVLHTDGTQSDLDYIATPRAVPTISETRHLRNIYSMVNNSKLSGTPNFVGSIRVTRPVVNSVYVGMQEELYKLSGKDFEFECLAEEMLPVVSTGRNFQYYYAPGMTNNTQFLINNGQMHMMSNQRDFEITFPAPLEPDARLGAVDLAPYIYVPSAAYTAGYAAVFYDRLGKRFVMAPYSYIPTPVKISPFDNQTSKFDVNNIGMDILWFERGYQDYGYAVFQDDAGAKWLYIADFNKKMDDNIAVNKYNMSSLPEANKIKFYSTGNRGEVFLYATERDIYTYEYNTSSQAVKINEPFGANEAITAMKVYKPLVTAYESLNAANGTLLYVATWDGNEGRIYEFSLNVANGYLRDKKPLEVFDGMGRIVDFCFKVEGNN